MYKTSAVNHVMRDRFDGVVVGGDGGGLWGRLETAYIVKSVQNQRCK